MASNQTSNYKLNQWAAEDRVMREEFNSDNAKIDAALGTIPVVKLREWAITEGEGSVVLDLSDLNVAAYEGLRLRFQFQNCSKNIYLSLGECDSYLVSSVSSPLNSNSYSAGVQLLNGEGYGHADLYQFGTRTVVFTRALQRNNVNSVRMTDSSALSAAGTTPGTMTTMTLTCYEGTFGAGCTAALYGLRY